MMLVTIRCLTAAAPLKLVGCHGVLPCVFSIRCLTAAAPLKREQQLGLQERQFGHPLPNGSGPIEPRNDPNQSEFRFAIRCLTAAAH